MTTNGPDEPRRPPGAPERATFLELLFDLAFVVALFQLSHTLIQHLSWSGALQSLVLLMAVWRIWLITTWITNRLDPQQVAIRRLVVATLTGSLVLAAALPQAFGRYGLIFASVYVAMHIGRHLFLTAVLRGKLQRVAMASLVWAGVSAVPWIAGGLAHGTLRVALWAFAVGLDYAVHAVDFPIPGAGRQVDWEPPVAADHLAERYRQVFIIALGEVILVIGLALSDSGFAPNHLAAFVVTIVAIVAAQHIYISRAGEVLSAAIAAAPVSTRLGRWAGYVHLVMVAGIFVGAVGAELVIAHPSGRTAPASAIVILGGSALYLAGRAGFEYAVFDRVSWDRPTGVLVLAAITPVALHVPPLLAITAGAVVLVAVAAADAARARKHPAELPSARARGPA